MRLCVDVVRSRASWFQSAPLNEARGDRCIRARLVTGSLFQSAPLNEARGDRSSQSAPLNEARGDVDLWH